VIPIPALRAVPWLALLLPCVLVLLPLGRSAELPIAIAAIVGIVLLARGRLRLDEAGPRLVLVLFACYWLPALLSAFAAVEPGNVHRAIHAHTGPVRHAAGVAGTRL